MNWDRKVWLSFSDKKWEIRSAITKTMFSNQFFSRLMSRVASKNRRQWEPPSKQIYVLRTPEKRPMRIPIDFRIPRTPDRVSAGEK